MYNELYETWKREKDSAVLEPLSKDFYTKLAEYVKKIREESRMLDERTARGRLLLHEAESVRKMVKELLMLRHKKVVKAVSIAEAEHLEGLSSEEERLIKDVAPSFESFQALLNEVMSGRLPAASHERPRKRVLRFLKETPAIIGADMKTYGPFQPQDVASLPVENARILTKQGVAVEVEVKLQPT